MIAKLGIKVHLGFIPLELVSCEQDPIQNYNDNIGNKASKRFFNYEFKH
jgi:hypothetical protein